MLGRYFEKAEMSRKNFLSRKEVNKNGCSQTEAARRRYIDYKCVARLRLRFNDVKNMHGIIFAPKILIA